MTIISRYDYFFNFSGFNSAYRFLKLYLLIIYKGHRCTYNLGYQKLENKIFVLTKKTFFPIFKSNYLSMTAAKVLSKYKSAIKSDLSIVKSSNNGIDASIFFELVEISGINRNLLAEEIFDVSVKTMQRYKKENKKLNPRNSEIALKLLNLVEKGIQIFGTMKSFLAWLSKPAFGLGEKVPISIMNTITGIDLIEEELIRIEYGALA